MKKFNLPTFLTKNIFTAGPSKNAEQQSGVTDPADWLRRALGGGSITLSGEAVNSETAMELDSFYAAVRNIAEDVAKLPLNTFEKTLAT